MINKQWLFDKALVPLLTFMFAGAGTVVGTIGMATIKHEIELAKVGVLMQQQTKVTSKLTDLTGKNIDTMTRLDKELSVLQMQIDN